MNLSRNKKGRTTVVIRARKLSSTNNRSQRSFLNSTATTVRYKKQISTLLKNNKVLALTLEDTRCELSTKQKLLDDLYQHLNNLMFARLRMLEMQSVLKSFTKNFDEVLLCLKVDPSKCPDVGVPAQSSKYWKNPMEKIVESVEIHSSSVADEMVDIGHKTAKKSLNPVSSAPKVSAEEVHDGREENCLVVNKNTSGTQVIPENASNKENENLGLNEERTDDENTIVMAYEQELSEPRENLSSNQVSNVGQETGSQLTSVLLSKDCGGRMPLKAAEKVAAVNSEVSGTPKLCISPKVVDAENISGLKANPPEKSCSSSDNKTSEMLKNSSGATSRVNIQCSKIPKMQTPLFKKKTKRNSLKQKHIKAKFTVGTKESNLNSCQSKELIIENEKKSDHEPVVLDKMPNTEIFSGKNIGESCKTVNSRKTFVIKPSVSEEPNSPSDRRKTFVKKPNDMSTALESIKNRRETFILPENLSALSKSNKECVTHDESSNLVKSIQSDVNLCTSKKDKPVTVGSSKDCQNNRRIFDNTSKDYSQKDNSECLVLKETENISKNGKSEKFDKITTSDANNVQNHSVEENETLNNPNSDLPDNLGNILGDKNIEVRYSKPPTEFPQVLLESPQSECESISELDLPPIETTLPLDKAPVRRQIPSKSKKLFFFDINEECIPNKTHGDCVQKNSNSVQQSTVPCLQNVGNEVKEYQGTENRKEKNKKKDLESDHLKNDIIDNVSSDSDAKKEALVNTDTNKEKVKSKSRKKDKCADIEITSQAVSNCIESKEPNEIPEYAIKNHGISVDILSKNGNLNEEKRTNSSSENENMNLKCPSDDGKLDASFRKVKNKERCRKSNRRTKRILSLEDDPDDIISAPRKSKRNISKKQSYVIKDIDDIISESKRKKQNNPEKKASKNTCVDEKMQKCPKKTKHKVRLSSVCSNTPEKNTFLVHADVHPVPTSSKPETDIPDKENEKIHEELQLSVVLNDIMKSGNNTLNVCRKDPVSHESKNSSLKRVLSDNSSNIPLPVDGTQEKDKNSAVTTSNSEDICEIYSTDRRRRRCTNVNYKEMSLVKKLRR